MAGGPWPAGGAAVAVGGDDLRGSRGHGQVATRVVVARDREGERGPPAHPAEVPGQGELDELVGDRVDEADVELVLDAEEFVHRPVRRTAVPGHVAGAIGDVDRRAVFR